MRCEGYMLIVRDIRASREFYQRVIGAEVAIDMGSHVVFAEGFSLLGEAEWLEIGGLGQGRPAYGHLAGQLGFEVEDIEGFVRGLERFPEVEMLHPLKEHPWGRRAVRLLDPDRHVVEVGESMRLVVKRFLRQGLTPEQAAARSEFPLAFVLACRAELEGAGKPGQSLVP